jgi:methyltransferase (TIGR00027 family)
MKKNRSSRTAEIVTAWRAAESLRPADDRICNDELAGKLIHPVYQFIGAFDFLRKLGLWYSEHQAPGIPGFVIARTRYIDDHLQACIHEGLEQLVILGAGLDSRAYRFQSLATTPVRVFEVDHPATQQVKIQRVLKAIKIIPEHVTYVPIDFDRDRLDQKLTAAGFSRNQKTFFILEGVVTYLTAEAVDNTLAFVTQNSGPGSSMIMSYIFKSVIDDSLTKDKETMRFRKAVQKRGEPATFGLDESDVEAFLTCRGFTRIVNVSMSYLEKQYFHHNNRHQRIFPWAGIAHAMVKS